MRRHLHHLRILDSTNDMTTLGLPATSIYAKPPTGVKAVTLETDQECAQSIAAGRKISSAT